ncbi:hypothetical protein [Staphylococcus hominis]|jgi:uncharacterized membrane protein|uniref:hypothetical protein n=1 Tax=Staphylococcus hominis TaxID=1290 RepID=UPI0011A40093|nr:hypothetical protein [Staphylococcus hominis]MCI2899838.1 hypothetical protein [Staphylococcus hominis]MCI2923966.1 hypothetical protein [Staphylococcus hominis]MDK7300839.1 hypothetical protein [Staphylococcus hominis]MDS3914235.1 hypothetical protein [Staphylococcus hominis]
MKDSIFWKKSFIPVYFIVALLVFLLFKFYIQTDNFSVYLLVAFLVILGLASIIYNSNTNR